MEDDLLDLIKKAAEAKELEFSIHAAREAYAESITPDEIRQALMHGQILENYPEHRRGACCLIYGNTDPNRPIHVVCTANRKPVLIITVYEPKLPKWVSPSQRSSQ